MKNALAILGLVLVVTSFTKLSMLGDWSTAQMAGYNGFTLASIFGGGYLIYNGLRKKKQNTEIK